MQSIKDTVNPFLKWVGSKKQLVNLIYSTMSDEFKSYHEPFLGGGSLFFFLHNQGLLKDKEVYLSDSNSELINSYIVVRDSVEELITLLEELSDNHSKEQYYEQRKMDRLVDFKDINPVIRAARFIYINKTCYNGLYRVNSQGFFNVPMGKYVNPKIISSDELRAVSKVLKNVSITCSDFKTSMSKVKKKDFVYIDPPYYPLDGVNSFTGYSKIGFGHKEQVELLDATNKIKKKGGLLIASNSNVPFVIESYSDYTLQEVVVRRHISSKVNSRGAITELLISNV